MARIAVINGLIAGALITVFWYVTKPLWEPEMNFALGEILGYVGMIISLVTVFVGIKSLRDNQLGGIITFKQGFLQGLYITLVASFIYVAGWEMYYNNAGSDMMDQYREYMIKEAKESGMSQKEIEIQQQEMDEMGELYTIAPIRWGLTLLEILPVGLIITIISALFLVKKSPQS